MILKNTNAINFLKTLLLENNPIKIGKNISFFSSKKIGFFSRLPSKKDLNKTPQESVWITSDSRVFKKNRPSLQTLYLLKKEKDTFVIYDRRWLKLTKGLYLLPPVDLTLTFLPKSSFLAQKEKELFFPIRSSPFYCEGDTTSRLKNPSYLKRLQAKQISMPPPLKIWQKIFLLLRKKLET